MPNSNRLVIEDAETAEAVRDTRRKLAAAEGQDLTLYEVIRRGMEALAQFAGLTKTSAP